MHADLCTEMNQINLNAQQQYEQHIVLTKLILTTISLIHPPCLPHLPRKKEKFLNVL